jgi:hypothetical protein
VSYSHKDNHVEEALANLLSQFKEQANIEALIEALAERWQGVEDVLDDVANSRMLETAVDAHLDGIGEIVGEDRQGRDDTAYRLAIRARIALNAGSGTAEDIYSIVALVLGETYVLRIDEYFPASFVLSVSGALPTADAEEVAAILESARPAAVGGQLLYSEEADATTFTFSSDDTEEASTDQGWADDAQADGGHMADVIAA